VPTAADSAYRVHQYYTGVTVVSSTMSSAASSYTNKISALSADVGTITYDLYKGTTLLNSTKFEATKVPAGVNGESYKLLSSASQIKKDKQGNITPSTTITFNAIKQVGTSSATAFTGAYFKVYVDGRLTFSGQGTIKTDGTTSASSTGNYVFDAITSVTKELKVELYSSSSYTVLLDRETIPVVVDGEDLVDYYVLAEPSQISYNPDDNSYIPSDKTIKFTFWKQIGNDTPTELKDNSFTYSLSGGVAQGKTSIDSAGDITATLTKPESVTINLYKGEILLDTETVSLVKDGEHAVQKELCTSAYSISRSRPNENYVYSPSTISFYLKQTRGTASTAIQSAAKVIINGTTIVTNANPELTYDSSTMMWTYSPPSTLKIDNIQLQLWEGAIAGANGVFYDQEDISIVPGAESVFKLASDNDNHTFVVEDDLELTVSNDITLPDVNLTIWQGSSQKEFPAENRKFKFQITFLGETTSIGDYSSRDNFTATDHKKWSYKLRYIDGTTVSLGLRLKAEAQIKLPQSISIRYQDSNEDWTEPCIITLTPSVKGDVGASGTLRGVSISPTSTLQKRVIQATASAPATDGYYYKNSSGWQRIENNELICILTEDESPLDLSNGSIGISILEDKNNGVLVQNKDYKIKDNTIIISLSEKLLNKTLVFTYNGQFWDQEKLTTYITQVVSDMTVCCETTSSINAPSRPTVYYNGTTFGVFSSNGQNWQRLEDFFAPTFNSSTKLLEQNSIWKGKIVENGSESMTHVWQYHFVGYDDGTYIADSEKPVLMPRMTAIAHAAKGIINGSVYAKKVDDSFEKDADGFPVLCSNTSNGYIYSVLGGNDLFSALVTDGDIGRWCYLYGQYCMDGGAIVTGSVTADKLKVNSLEAISGNMGTLTAGVIQSANYGIRKQIKIW
jgi:hypothetical protein